VKLIQKSALALMLGVLVLASAASAGYVQSVGGATTSSSSGGATYGITASTTYDDSGTGTLGGPLLGATALTTATFNDVLTEVTSVNANVANGVTGDASASFTTNGEQKVTQNLPSPAPAPYAAGSYISTSLDGVVAASVSKTTPRGPPTASAVMQAQSAASPIVAGTAGQVGGTAELYATATLSGAGSVLAEATGTATHDSNLGLGDLTYSKGYASGDAKVSGTNDIYGGASSGISGTADIYAGTSLIDTAGVVSGQSITTETIDLAASRGISFAGDSKIEALLDGSESGESSYSAGLLQPTIVDNDAVSVMDAMARALNRHDTATTNLAFRAETGTDGVHAMADSNLGGTASVTRDSIGGTEKAQAEGFITHAAWTASTQLPAVAPAINEYASVEGQTGSIDNTDSEGLGVGAWILTPNTPPMIATASQTQLAASGAVAAVDSVLTTPILARGNTEVYTVGLIGMTASGHTNDAVGAYLGIGSQILSNVDPAGVPIVSTTHESSRNGIEWLEGGNTDILPGHYSNNIVPVGVTQTATTRTSGLLGI